MYSRRAFSLVELLVVIGVIMILLAFLLPAVAKARASAYRTRCAAQLGEIGHMLQMYFGENKNTLPRVNEMPSLQPPLNNYPSLPEVLAPYARGSPREKINDQERVLVFDCPVDRITQPTQNAPAGYETYFAREGTSYRWNSMVNIRGSRIMTLGAGDRISLLDEFEPFHGKPGAADSMNYLYADCHVGGGDDSNLTIVVH